MAILSTLAGAFNNAFQQALASPINAKTIGVTVALLVVSAVLLLRRRPSKGPLPPSPAGKWPILGHLPLLASTDRPDRLLDRLSEEIGPIYHLQLGTITAVIISNDELARESLIKKGKTYAGRWTGKVLMLFSNQGRDVAMAPYGEYWRKMRRIVHKVLTPLALNELDTRLEIESIRLVQHLFANPGRTGTKNTGVKVQRILASFSCNIVLSKSLAMTFETPDDPLFQMICDSIDEIFHLAALGGLEDYFPGGLLEKALVYPKSRAIKPLIQRYKYDFIRASLVRIKESLDKEIASGLNPRNRDLAYAEEIILNMKQEELDLDDIMGFITDFLTAGMETTASTLHWIILYLINFPEVQRRAHAEIDKVTEGKRLPNLTDIDALPYLRAVIKETTRISPVSPVALPRMTTEEDFDLAGYYVPNGAQVIYNVTGIHRDLYRNEDHTKFNPDRWMQNVNPDGTSSRRGSPKRATLAADTDDEGRRSPGAGSAGRSLDILDGNYTFGQGRRLCPGVHLAYREMFLALSRILTFFRIESVDGKPLPVDSKFGLTLIPEPQVQAVFIDRQSPLRENLAQERHALELRLQQRSSTVPVTANASE